MCVCVCKRKKEKKSSVEETENSMYGIKRKKNVYFP